MPKYSHFAVPSSTPPRYVAPCAVHASVEWTCSNRLNVSLWQQIWAITSDTDTCWLWQRASQSRFIIIPAKGIFIWGWHWSASLWLRAELADLNWTPFLKFDKAFGYLAQGFLFAFQRCLLCSEILLLNPQLCSYFNICPIQRPCA